MQEPEAEECGIWRMEAICDASWAAVPSNGAHQQGRHHQYLSAPATPPVLVGPGTVPEAASGLYPFMQGAVTLSPMVYIQESPCSGSGRPLRQDRVLQDKQNKTKQNLQGA